MEDYILCKSNKSLECKSVITYFVHDMYNIEFMVNLLIPYGKFHIHKSRTLKKSPNFTGFLFEFKEFIKSLELINTKISNKTVKLYDELFKE